MKWWAIWRVYLGPPARVAVELTEVVGPFAARLGPSGIAQHPVMTFQRDTQADAERVLAAYLQHEGQHD